MGAYVCGAQTREAGVRTLPLCSSPSLHVGPPVRMDDGTELDFRVRNRFFCERGTGTAGYSVGSLRRRALLECDDLDIDWIRRLRAGEHCREIPVLSLHASVWGVVDIRDRLRCRYRNDFESQPDTLRANNGPVRLMRRFERRIEARKAGLAYALN